MNIKKHLLISSFLVSFAILPVAADTTPPAAISDLTVSSGPATGSIKLTWTATGDDGTMGAASQYIIKYTFNNTITTQSEFDGALHVDGPPLNQPIPVPAANGSTEVLEIHGLIPGNVYGFSIVALDEVGNPSPLSNSATAQASDVCVQHANDGKGTATFAPSAVPSGELVLTTMTFTVASGGIKNGGLIAMRIPDGWPQPSTTTFVGNAGHVPQPSTSGGATLTPGTSNQLIVVQVSSSDLNSGDTVDIYYYADMCTAATNETVKVFSQYESCGVLAEIASSPQVNIQNGGADRIDIQPYDQYLNQGTISAVDLVVLNRCGNEVSLSGGSSNVTIRAEKSNPPAGFVTDPNALMDSNAAFGSPSPNINVAINSGESKKTFYYKIDTTAEPFNHFLNFSYTAGGGLESGAGQARMIPLSSGISDTSVDTGVIVAGQKTVTFTPNFDGSADDVFINFTLPTASPYDVLLSSDSFNTTVHEFNGTGQNVRLAWNGFKQADPSVSDPATYAVKIILDGGNIVDTSLSVTLQANSAQGIIKEKGSSTLLNDARIDVFGPSHHFAESDTQGEFKVNGLQGGNYTARIEKEGYVSREVQFAAVNGTINLGTIELDVASLLKIHATRPNSGFLGEVFGEVRANTADWSRQAVGSVHFSLGSTASDAGDQFNTTPSSFTILSLAPDVQYRVKYSIPNHGANEFNITLTAGQVVERVEVLTKRANIEGSVTLPSGSNTSDNGRWISVDACLGGDCTDFDPSKRFYGGVWLPKGVTTGIYRIFGVPAGNYRLQAHVPGFVRQEVTTSVVGATDVTGVNFPTFSQGSIVIGNITVNGDTTQIDEQDGVQDSSFTVHIHARSDSSNIESFTQIQIPVNSVSVSQAYSFGGFTDGGYSVFTHIPGFESIPPGPKRVSVSGGSGNLDLTFQQYNGVLTGPITLPGGSSDFNQAVIQLNFFHGGFNSGSPPVPTISGNTYTFSNLGTGLYILSGYWPNTGYRVTKNIQIVNGGTTTVPLELAGETYSISGTVSLNSDEYDSLQELVDESTPTVFYNQVTQATESVNVNRVVAERVLEHGGPPPMHNGNQQPGIPYNPAEMFFGFYDTTTGDYTISNLSPGIYRLYNNAELSNFVENGSEVAEISEVVGIFKSNLTGKNITIIDGYDVNGTVRIKEGSESGAGRQIRVILRKGSKQDFNDVTQQILSITGTQANFNLQGVAPGSYVLLAQDSDSPIKYAAKPVPVTVETSDVDNKTITLETAAKIQGRLKVRNGAVISAVNFNDLLPAQFNIEARGFDGGHFIAEQPLVGSNDKFSIPVQPGVYNVVMDIFGFIGDDAIAKGKKQFVPATFGPFEVEAGEIKDLGDVELVEGSSISGVVKDDEGNLLPNVLVRADLTEQRRDTPPLEAFTDKDGKYVIHGIDNGDDDREGTRFYYVTAAPRPRGGDFLAGITGTDLYAEVRKYIDTKNQTTDINFVLTQAAGSIAGRVVTPDGGPLEFPFGDNVGFPGAVILANPVGNIPLDNPIGDIEVQSDPNGNFSINGLASGAYDLTAFVGGYAAVDVKNIQVQSGETNIGVLEVLTGSKLSGTIRKTDGSFPNQFDLDILVAVQSGFSSLIIGVLKTNPSGGIESYELNGFQSDKSYAILGFDSDDNIFALGTVTVNEDTEKNLILTPIEPDVFGQAFKNTDDSLSIKFDFTSAIRNSQIDLDSDGVLDDSAQEIFTLTEGNGTLTFGSDAISNNRKRGILTYTPATGETSFTIQVNATFIGENPETGDNYTVSKDFQFFVGIGNSKTIRILNAQAEDLNLDSDPSRFLTKAGIFGNDETLKVSVTMRSAQTQTAFNASNVGVQHSRALAVAKQIGYAAYPGEMASAMMKLESLNVDPLSSFYDIFLPATVSHFFPEGKEAQLCLAYDTSVTDPSTLNIYYFNTKTSEYVIENQNRRIDTDNRRICVDISHASIFTVLNSSATTITGNNYTGDLNIINFPNPFDLTSKDVTLQNPGSSNANQTIQGTMIKFSVPPSMSGNVIIEIYNVLGEKVRTLSSNVTTGGNHFYLEWDGKNSSGRKVASGTYIARFTIGGANERFFKMAVVK